MLKSTGSPLKQGISGGGVGIDADRSLGIKTGGLKMEVNGEFLKQVLEQFQPETRLIVGSANKDR